MNNTITLLGSKIYYEIHGEGIPMLMIHGWSVNHHLMSGCMEPIFEDFPHQVKRIYFDLPGMGQSQASMAIKCSDEVLEVILALIDTLIPNDPFILAGESYGGYLSRALIKKRREQILGVMLLCPAVFPGYRKGEVSPLTVLERDHELLESLSQEERESFEYMNVILNERVFHLFKRDIMDVMHNDDYFLNHILDGAFTYPVDPLDPPFVKPSLILVGRQDTEVGYKDQFKLLDDYPRASFIALDKAGHNLQIEQEILYRCVTREWLERVFAELSSCDFNTNLL